MGFRSLVSVVLIGAILTGCGGGGGGDSGGGDDSGGNDSITEAAAPTPIVVSPPSCSTELGAIFSDLLMETNKVRVDRGFSALRLSYKLGQAAQGHAEDMANRDYFAHTSPDGLSTIASRIQAADYLFSTAAENIAAGYNSAEDVVAAWLDSPGHRVNLLNPDYIDVGFGLFFDLAVNSSGSSNFDSYWVQDFGRPTDSNTDSEAAYIPSNCSIGDIASSDTAVLNGAITADDLDAVEPELLTVATSGQQAVLSDNQNNDPVSTPEPAMALGLLTAVLGLISPRRKNS